MINMKTNYHLNVKKILAYIMGFNKRCSIRMFLLFYLTEYRKIMKQKLFCRVLNVEYNRIQDNY